MRIPTLLLAIALSAAPAFAAAESPALKGLIDAFDAADLVMLGERPQSKLDSDLRNMLVANPAFLYKVNDVVVEFASVRYQSLLDRYVLELQDVPRDSLVLAWRDATQPGTWESPVYEDLIQRVRLANRTLPPQARVRIVAADPAVDWRMVTQWSDVAPVLASRPEFAAQVIEREVLDRKRKGLVIFGARSLHRTDRELPVSASITRRLVTSRPDARVFVVATVPHSDSLVARMEATVESKDRPLLLRLARHPMGNLPALALFPYGAGTLSQMADALLYYGNVADRPMRPGRALSEDQAFMEELRRRRAIVGL